ncbi:hypothetical protein CCUS01_09099 [Colletotrichum cuscutae]|uniref:Uncharacterized protein n=1 Tax=Colletotrichum cuscutae TaxID=1209917 RepID=A0AAI9XQ88_9PEZI|nr:hypothetical protein CCUS01_09099 [Colletotrichum cuscutae]
MHFQFLSNSLPSSQSQTPTSFFSLFSFSGPFRRPRAPNLPYRLGLRITLVCYLTDTHSLTRPDPQLHIIPISVTASCQERSRRTYIRPSARSSAVCWTSRLSHLTR